jgi:fructan beta-fructosidase
MRHNLIIIIITLLSVPAFSQENKKEVFFNETYRPQYHFTPVENRMGSPISIVKTDSTYHLFYQWNPHNLQNGFVNWGYAISYDLLKWKHIGISLSQPDGVTDSMAQTPWWGSVVYKDNQLIAWANSWNEGIFRYSSFAGGKWGNKEKVTGIDELTNVDPYVFWYEKTNMWCMLAFNRADSTMHFLNSLDGLGWKQTSTFNFRYGLASITQLRVDDKADDTRWVFLTEDGNYMLGKFDGQKFELTSPYIKFDYGNMVGGSIIFSDPQSEKIYLISELRSEQNADIASNGQLTFPNEISLHGTSSGIELIRKPAVDIQKLYKKNYEWDGKKVYPGLNNNILQAMRGDCFHIKGTINLKNSDYFGIVVRSDKDNVGTDINYNVSKKEMILEGNRISFKPENNTITFEMLIDRSSVELFVDGGRYVISSPIVPEPKNLRYFLYTVGGEIQIDHLEAHELKSVWR